MIHSAEQIKAKIRNVSKGNSVKAQAMLRTFFMERFLERVSLSVYKDQFILKGGMLVSSLIGENLRSTMDIDTTVKVLPLTVADAKRIVSEISEIELGDHVTFEIMSVDTIMEEFDYPGVRLHMNGYLDRMRQALKIDISTDDVITPGAVIYQYPLMFEDRVIRLNTYNVETLLAEKSQTILARGESNTRMRDFYDIYEIVNRKEFSVETYRQAFYATCRKRGTVFANERIRHELSIIELNADLQMLWERFRDDNYFVEQRSYQEIMDVVTRTICQLTE